MRRRPLSAFLVPAAALGLAAAPPAPALAAPPAPTAPTAAFDLNGTFTASLGSATMGDVGGGNSWGTDGGCRFRQVRAYSGVQLASPTGPSYTLVALVRVATVSGKRRLLDFSAGRSDDGLYVRDGRLAVVRGGADVASSSGAVFERNAWRQVVLTRAADGTLTAYVEGEPVLTYADTTALAVGAAPRLFRDDWLDATAGGVARLRLYAAPLGAEDVRALQDDKLDTVAPTVDVASPEGRIGGRPTLTGTVADAGSAPARIAARAEIVDATGTVVASASAPVGADGRFAVPYPAAAPTLADGRTYTLRASATDAAGNGASAARTAVADTAGPAVALTAPGTIAGARPSVTGTVADAASRPDQLTAAVEVLDDATGAVVASGPAAVGADGTFSFTYPDGTPDLGEGRTYAFRATATDHLGNSASTASQALSDGVAPQGLTVDSPATDVTIPSPFVAGHATVRERDAAAVTIAILHGGAPVVTFGAPVADGRYSARIPVGLGEGGYTALVTQCDSVGNCASASRPFSVSSLPQLGGWEVRPPASTGSGSGTGDAAATPAAVARRLLSSLQDALAAQGARRLAKPTTLKLSSPLAGTVRLRIVAGTRVLVQGTRRFATPGAGRIALSATKRGRTKLRRVSKLKATVRLTVTPRSGKAVTVDGPLTLTRAARR